MSDEELKIKNKRLAEEVLHLRKEIEILTDSSEDIHLLGTISSKIVLAETMGEIIGIAIESVSLLKDLAYCAFLSISDTSVKVIDDYGLHLHNTFKGKIVPFDKALKAMIEKKEYFNELPDGEPLPDFISHFSDTLRPNSYYIMPLYIRDKLNGIILCVNCVADSAHLRRLLPLLDSICNVMRTRLETLSLITDLTSSNEKLTCEIMQRKLVEGEREKLIRELDDDITERKKIEDAFHESEERFRMMMHQSPSVIELYDYDGLQIEVNEAYEALWGFPASHTVKKFNVLRSKEVEETGLMIYVKEAYAGKSVTVPEYKFNSTGATEAKGKGRIRWLSTKIYPLKDRADNVKNVVITHEDISDIKFAEEERTKLKEQLQHSKKMESFGALAGGIAHDFNNILNAIMGFTYLAKIKTPESSKAVSNLNSVMEATNRAAELVGQILTFSRMGGEAYQPIQVTPIVKDALKLLRASIPTTIEIRQNIGSAGNVLADPVQIQQIIMNLCTNAYHAMQESGGVLNVDMQEVNIDPGFASKHDDMKAGPHARLTVSDMGCGIDSSVINRIFEPYYTTKEKGKGTGLGMSVVHGIVKNCGGTITVSSELNKGTTCEVYLPVTNKESRHGAEADEALPKGSGTVLFVDDETSIVVIGGEILESLGYKVITSTDSQTALELFREDPDKFDVVLTDMTMPKMTGIKLSQEIHRIRPGVPIILTTGYSEGINEEVVKNAGIRELLIKPVSPEKLSQTIRKVLKKNLNEK